MKALDLFGFPAGLQTDTGKIVPGEGVDWLVCARKYSKGMFGLLADESYRAEDEPYYDFYQSIGRTAERPAFAAENLRYDCTVILPGTAAGEYKKTAGHFHCAIPGKSYSYPEYYQVIHGKALFVMQRVTNPQTDGKMVVEDALLAEVNAGEAIVVPPDYGHCTVNIGDGAMVFANLISRGSENDYAGVRRSAGMCCYIKEEPARGYRIEQNPRYAFACTPRTVTAGDSDLLGVRSGVSVYTQFLQEPDKYRYLDCSEYEISTYLSAFHNSREEIRR